MRPREVGLAAPAVVPVPADAAADGGEHGVAELDQVEVVHAHAGLGQPPADRGAEPGRWVDRDHLHPPSPPPGLLLEPVRNGGRVATIDHVDDLTGGQVDEGGHPRLDPPPGSGVVLEPTHAAEPVLIDPQEPHQPGPGPAPGHQCRDGLVDEALHGGPRHPELARNPVDGADLTSDRGEDGVLEPLGEPGPRRDLVGVLGERPTPAQLLGACPALLDPHHLDRAVERHLSKPVPRPLMHPRGQHTAVRAGRFGHRGGDHHHPHTVLVTYDLIDLVLGQVEQHRRPRGAGLSPRLSHARGPVCWMLEEHPACRRATSTYIRTRSRGSSKSRHSVRSSPARRARHHGRWRAGGERCCSGPATAPRPAS